MGPDIVGPYTNPPDRTLVLCVDEKPQLQAIERTALVLPMRPSRIERHTHDYVRHGTTDVRGGRLRLNSVTPPLSGFPAG
jgi:hypothetical protein